MHGLKKLAVAVVGWALVIAALELVYVGSLATVGPLALVIAASGLFLASRH